MVPGDRHSLVVETSRYPVEESGPVHIVLDVFLAGPDDLDRTVDMLRDLDGASDTIDLQPPAKAAANQMVVHDDLVQRQARDLCGSRLGARDDLVADPDFAAVLADMRRAVHRLHCRVREERDLVGRLDLGNRTRHGFVGVADILRHRPRIERGLFQRAHDLLRVELGVRAVVPFDHQGRQPLLRSPHMVGHDRDGIVEPHDLTHALDGLGCRIIHALHASAEDGRLCKGRDLHAGRPNVDAIDGRSVDLRRRVQTLGRGADELEILRPLERHALGDRHAGGIRGKFAILDPSSRRRVKHFTALRAAGRCIHIPALGRRRDEHGSGGRTGLAQRLPRRAYRVRVASCLYAGQ